MCPRASSTRSRWPSAPTPPAAAAALGIVAARWLCRRLAGVGVPLPPGPGLDPATTTRVFDHPRAGAVEGVETALTGMYLLEAVVGASRLIVVDTVVTGAAAPGSGGGRG